LGTVAVSVAEETYLGLLIMTGLWAIISGACLVATVHASQRSASWFWASSFLAASLVAACYFGRLL
jgi:hypothetical protein